MIHDGVMMWCVDEGKMRCLRGRLNCIVRASRCCAQ